MREKKPHVHMSVSQQMVHVHVVSVILHAVFITLVMCAGDSGALYLSEGDTPTSGEAEGRE